MILIVDKCATCPFCNEPSPEQKECNIATPKRRPIPADNPRPKWCPVRQEKIIVRDKNVR